jgi:hypothetical protein
MEIKYNFLDETLKSETRKRYKEDIEPRIRDKGMSCSCDNLIVAVIHDPVELSYDAMVRCGCRGLEPVTFHFPLV